MLFTTLVLPEDIHLVSGRTAPRRKGGVRIDGRPPAPHRGADPQAR